jgi:hypothetical protein
MARIITLTGITVDSWTVDVQTRRVAVNYSFTDETGRRYPGGTAYFCAETDPGVDPFTGKPVPTSENVYPLPVTYQQHLADLTGVIIQALKNKLLA